MPKIVVLDGWTLSASQPGDPAPPGDPDWGPLMELGELVVHDRTPEEQVVERAAGAEVVLTNKTVLDASALARLGSLRYVGVLATGTNVVDLGAASERGIVVTNAPGYSTDSVAQHAIALLLELANQVGVHDRAVRGGRWAASEDFCFTLAPLTELAGRTLAIIGMGAIGQRVARIGAAMGMRVAAAPQRSMAEVTVPGAKIEWLELDELFAEADVLSLHCPLTERTEGIVSRARLARMKPSAFVINTGRGPLIDEAALAEALHAGRIAGAGLDVLSEEPPRADNPLLTAPRCVVTPHTAWATKASKERLMHIAADNVRGFLDGQAKHVVN
ncbi:MAG: D-2-hydroxyacid dehydrogenase [Phycisphaeraceae bacterium]